MHITYFPNHTYGTATRKISDFPTQEQGKP